MITLGSLFDGIGGWQLAAVKNGVKPLWSRFRDREVSGSIEEGAIACILVSL